MMPYQTQTIESFIRKLPNKTSSISEKLNTRMNIPLGQILKRRPRKQEFSNIGVIHVGI